MAISDFLVSSDYPTDMLVFITQGQQLVPAMSFSTFVNIPHGLPFRPLPYIVWSLTPDFAETYFYTTPDDLVNVETFCLGENVSMGMYNSRSSSVTVYYRLFGFPPSTIGPNDFAPSTSSQGSDFLINSSVNYMKLVKAGVISTSDRVYQHNLGYVPTVLVWLKTTHDTYVFSTADRAYGGTAGIKLTNSTIEFVGASINDTAVEFRLYADD